MQERANAHNTHNVDFCSSTQLSSTELTTGNSTVDLTQSQLFAMKIKINQTANTPTGASTNTENFDLNKNLNMNPI